MNTPQPATWIDYDYAVIRLVPRVHRGAFINLGVLVHARSTGYLAACFRFDRERIAALAPEVDLDMLERYVTAFEQVCRGGTEGGPIGLLPPSERFHWLTSPRSTMLQTSPVHPGRSHDLGEALARLAVEHCDGGLL